MVKEGLMSESGSSSATMLIKGFWKNIHKTEIFRRLKKLSVQVLADLINEV